MDETTQRQKLRALRGGEARELASGLFFMPVPR
jgi:hypothetical protein